MPSNRLPSQVWYDDMVAGIRPALDAAEAARKSLEILTRPARESGEALAKFVETTVGPPIGFPRLADIEPLQKALLGSPSLAQERLGALGVESLQKIVTDTFGPPNGFASLSGLPDLAKMAQAFVPVGIREMAEAFVRSVPALPPGIGPSLSPTPSSTAREWHEPPVRTARIAQRIIRRNRIVVVQLVDERILRALRATSIAAFECYAQAMDDLEEPERSSWRGTAHLFRESLREILDFLAPAEEVTVQANYRNEPGQDRPTHTQKARYVLRKRRVRDGVCKTVEFSLSVADEILAKLTRSVYERLNESVHSSKDREELLCALGFLRPVLLELLGLPPC